MFKPVGCGPNIRAGKDTVRVETHTEYIPQPPVQIPVYIPTQSSSQAPIIIPPSYQPSANYEALLKQYNDLANKFLSVNTYKDSITLKDTSGTRVGVVNLQDVVSENQIKARNPSYQLSFPHTTTTITIKDPPNRQLFLGFGLSGMPLLPVNGADLGLVYKNKQDHLFEFKVGARALGPTIQPNFELGTYWKIKFHK
jgi:hypothetical protein